jgi:hypothetical protein
VTSSPTSVDDRLALIKFFAQLKNRPLAHQSCFRHRHGDRTPPFHDEIILLWHDPLPSRVLVMAFREAAKSTIAEESIVLMAALHAFRNCVILGENQERAVDRLTAIKHEFATNDYLINLFGELRDGSKWNEAKVILKNGVIIQALGRGQEVRGMKHLDIRPDFCFADDVEGKEHVKDERARTETLRWFFAEVLPALDKNARVRVNATPLDTASLPMQLKRLDSWTSRVYPIRYLDDTGSWRATWPERYSLSWIAVKETEMRRLGLHHEFMREYMCEPDDPAKKLFNEGMFRVEPRLHVWQPTYAFYDPARTVSDRSNFTGWAVWSWVGTKLIVWDGGGEKWLPDEMINHIFKINEQYHPVMIGVEKDGLEEYVQQPLRREMVRRGILLPLTPMRAPVGKLDFIGSLQPFFSGGEVTFAKELPDLKAQFLNFPTGQIDGPNALAYALRMRPGLAVHEDFGSQHVVEQVLRVDRSPIWLCLNATAGCTTGVLVQFADGHLGIWRDWVLEGDTGVSVPIIAKECRLELGKSELRFCAPREHFGSFDTIGLAAAVRRLPMDLQQGGDVIQGRDELRMLMRQQVKGLPGVQVAHAAHWTINALSSGYAREISSSGVVKDLPRPGVYATLMQGLEAFAGLMRFVVDDAYKPNYAFTASGKRYQTLLPDRQPPQDLKTEWGRVLGRR